MTTLPAHEHDCDHCIYLGSETADPAIDGKKPKTVDFYAHTREPGHGVNLIRRFGRKGDYSSLTHTLAMWRKRCAENMHFAKEFGPLVDRAEAAGLFREPMALLGTVWSPAWHKTDAGADGKEPKGPPADTAMFVANVWFHTDLGRFYVEKVEMSTPDLDRLCYIFENSLTDGLDVALDKARRWVGRMEFKLTEGKALDDAAFKEFMAQEWDGPRDERPPTPAETAFEAGLEGFLKTWSLPERQAAAIRERHAELTGNTPAP